MLSSTVFRLTLIYSLGFFLVALVLGSLVGSFYLNQIDNEHLEEHREWVGWVSELYAEEGIDALREELESEEDIEWDEEYTVYRLFDEEFALLIEDEDGRLELGYPGLADTGEDWEWLEFEEAEEFIEVRSLTAPLQGGHLLTLSSARSHEYHYILELMSSGFYWLLLIIVPLSLLTGYALSRGVIHRLNRLSGTVEAIGRGSMAERIHVERDDEFGQLSLQVNAMLDRIEALHRNLETTSVGIAHDLKTPLSRLANRLHLMQQDIDNPGALGAHLEVAQSQLQSVIQTFQGLLRLGEIESGERRKQFAPLNLSELVSGVVESYEPVFSDVERELETSVVPDVQLAGDPDLLIQMLTNLLENSIEHGRAGGRTWVRLQASPEGAVLQVGDDGPGIPAEQHDRVFERFYRGDASRGAPGNGLGLSIVKAVCELHRGRVALLGQQSGAVFDCYLPASR